MHKQHMYVFGLAFALAQSNLFEIPMNANQGVNCSTLDFNT